MAGGENINVGKAYVTIVPSLEGSQKTITEELTGVTSTASEKAGSEGGSKFGTKFAKAVKGTAVAIGAAVTAATGAAVATSKAFLNAAKDTATYGDEVDKTSQKLGLSNKCYQELDYVMRICGTEMSSMTTGLKTLTNKFDDAMNGSASAQEMFGKLGLSMEDLAGLSREDLLKTVIERFQQMPDSAERAALANDLFAKSGQNLAPLFNMSSEATQELIDKANDLGMIMTDEGVKASAEYKDSLTTLDGTMTGLKNRIMTQFMPGLAKATEGLADALGGKGTGKLTDGIKLLMAELKRMGPVAFKLISEIGVSVIQGLGPLLPDLVSTIFNLMIGAITTVTSMIPQMMPAIILGLEGVMKALLNALPVIINGLTTLMMSLVQWLASDDNVKMLVDGIIAMTAQLTESVAMILPVLLPAIVNIIAQISDSLTDPQNIEMMIQATLVLVGAIFTALVNMVPEFIELIKKTLKNAGNLLGDFLYWIVPKVAGGLENVINTIKGWGQNVLGFFTGLWTKVKESVTNGLNNIKSKFTSIFETVKTTVKNGIDKIKSFFNFNWSLPKLKLPHFTIKGSFSINPPKVPTFGISWYAKAMEDPMILNGATIFGAKNGQLLGGGEAGSEVIVGTNKLMEMMKDAVGINGQPITINVYGAEGQNVNDLAEVIADKLEEMTNRKGAAYA